MARAKDEGQLRFGRGWGQVIKESGARSTRSEVDQIDSSERGEGTRSVKWRQRHNRGPASSRRRDYTTMLSQLSDSKHGSISIEYGAIRVIATHQSKLGAGAVDGHHHPAHVSPKSGQASAHR